MHIIIAILGSIVTILILVNRLKDAGIDLSALNPFHWYHRQKWKNRVSADPLYGITDPMEAAAALLYTVAKLSGDISSEQKSLLLDIYEQDFKLTKQLATDLLSSNAYLIKDEDKISQEVNKFLALSLEGFSPEQRQSTLALMDRVIAVEERESPKQQAFRAKVEEIFQPPVKSNTTW